MAGMMAKRPDVSTSRMVEAEACVAVPRRHRPAALKRQIMAEVLKPECQRRLPRAGIASTPTRMFREHRDRRDGLHASADRDRSFCTWVTSIAHDAEVRFVVIWNA